MHYHLEVSSAATDINGLEVPTCDGRVSVWGILDPCLSLTAI